MRLVLGIALAGALGTLARFGLGGWIQERTGSSFPWGTLVINVIGSLVLGFVFRFGEGMAMRAETRVLLSIGFCGAFTTFSTFSFETARFIEEGQWNRALAYVMVSTTISLMAMFFGFFLAATLLRRS